MSVLIAGGGTGGHLYPGIAVAREVKARVPDAEVAFVGTTAGIESRVVPREGFMLETIRSAGLKGKSLASLARGVGLLPMSALDAWRVEYLGRKGKLTGVLRGLPELSIDERKATGAAANALTTSKLGPIKLVAMADVFEHKLKGSYDTLNKKYSSQIDVSRTIDAGCYRRRRGVLLAIRRRGIGRRCGSVPPSAAKRLAAAR